MDMGIPKEVSDLLWFGDGEYKNWEDEILEHNGYRTIVHEPSAIYGQLPISDNLDMEIVEDPGYYPDYKELSPEQRRVYFDFLRDIYDYSFHISYVFLFYYGLERYLSRNEKYDEAFNTILRLRNSHTNSSFQHYSANALLFSALKHERNDLIKEFLKSCSGKFSIRALLFVLYKLEIPLTAQTIIDNAKFFGYDRRKYLRKYPDLFLKALESELIKNFGADEILISDFIKEEQLKDLKETFEFAYANYSLEEREIHIPDISSSEEFYKIMHSLLFDAEEVIKENLTIKK